MPFLRIEKKKSGTYLRILESYRDTNGKSTHRILYSIGKVEDYTPEQLRSFGIKFYELGGGEIKNLFTGQVSELGRFNYGYQLVYGKAISHYGLKDLFTRIAKRANLEYDLYNVLLIMILDRLQDPCSKLSTYHNQADYTNLPPCELHHLYRTLDRLDANSDLIQKHIFQVGRDLFNNKLDVVFYDVTTFYFESEVENENELRQLGFGKDGKLGHTQVLFSMLIDKDKNPIGYRVYSGNTYEGDTFKKALEDLKKSYSIEKVIVVADRGMLSKNNVALIQDNGYEFILGERLKSLPNNVKDSLLDINNYKSEWIYTDNEGEQIKVRYTTLEYGQKTLICTYSDKRAHKDQLDREKKIIKAQILLQNTSELKTKQRRFFIKQQGENTYQLDQNKIDQNSKYDGFLVIATNTMLKPTQVLENYKQLYKIEHSFRTFKSHLETRPMYHWTDKRIRGHICLCYIAYCLQNYVLKKVNKAKNKITENSSRSTLDKMQLSLIQTEQSEVYVRSAPSEIEQTILFNMGIKPLMPMIKKELLSI